MSADLPFLCWLYGTTRTEEVALSGWPECVASAFLGSQFALQHRHFLTVGGTTDFWIVEHRGEPIGRLYLRRGTSVWRVLDIALLPEWRSRGLGGVLLSWTKMSARVAMAEAVDLHVLSNNPRAAALYRRLGFVATDAGTATHRHMMWVVGPDPASRARGPASMGHKTLANRTTRP